MWGCVGVSYHPPALNRRMDDRSLHPLAAALIGVGRRRAPSSPFRAIIHDLGPRSAGALKRTGTHTHTHRYIKTC